MLIEGDAREQLRELEPESIDAIVTDPPYGLAFMGKRWDADVPPVEVWAECLRVLKPGGHLLAFAGTRTHHRMTSRIADAGFEIRDMIAWVYGSGFPKSLDVSKAIDKAGGNTDAARRWQGWGTALKPAMEPITVARKPLDGTVAENVLAHGTGALNIDGCRVETNDNLNGGAYSGEARTRAERTNSDAAPGAVPLSRLNRGVGEYTQPAGRWPANLIHDGSDEVLEAFPRAGGGFGTENRTEGQGRYGKFSGATKGKVVGYGDEGSAARFFYCAKASRHDRNEGCEALAEKPLLWSSGEQNPGAFQSPNTNRAAQNHHPTVKPTELMRYLCRLVTPPGGVVLDPFAGSGSTGKAAVLEGFRFIGIEREAEYVAIARARVAAVRPDAQRNLWPAGVSL